MSTQTDTTFCFLPKIYFSLQLPRQTDRQFSLGPMPWLKLRSLCVAVLPAASRMLNRGTALLLIPTWGSDLALQSHWSQEVAGASPAPASLCLPLAGVRS